MRCVLWSVQVHNYGTMNSLNIWYDSWNGCSSHDEACNYTELYNKKSHIQGWFRTRHPRSLWGGTVSKLIAFCLVLLVVSFQPDVFWKWLYCGQSCTLPRDVTSAGKTLFNRHFHINASRDGTVWACHSIQLKLTTSMSEYRSSENVY